MTLEELNKKTSKYNWQPWLKRPFFGFIMSTFCGGNTRDAFKKIGLSGWECDFLFSDWEWYSSEKSYQKAKPIILKWFKTHSFKEISERLEDSRLKWIAEIKEMSKNPAVQNPQKLAALEKMLREITTYVWATHASEYFFAPIFKKQVSKLIKNDLEKYIGDISFPIKENSAAQMVEAYRKGQSPAFLAKNFGWMRARDAFSKPYSAKELVDIAKHALKHPKHSYPNIPKQLEKLVAEARELVYLRMLRMDVYYELVSLAKPLLQIPAKKFNIKYEDLKYYTLDSLIQGKPKYFPADLTCASVDGKCYFFNRAMFKEVGKNDIREIRGTVAQTGKATGVAKILMKVQDLAKVKKGDILVTYMTSPNFLPAMKLAAAFVTNEGGLTCHAAIMAREMKKPCITGTKIATQIFKDGDIIEVDATKGIIKKI